MDYSVIISEIVEEMTYDDRLNPSSNPTILFHVGYRAWRAHQAKEGDIILCWSNGWPAVVPNDLEGSWLEKACEEAGVKTKEGVYKILLLEVMKD